MNIRFITREESEKANALNNRLDAAKRNSILQWEWEFYSPFISSSQSPFVVAEEHNHIVGTQALIPVRMIDSNGIFPSAKSEETLIDPAYRGKGLFGKMYEKLFVHCEELQVPVIWGFCTENSRSAFEHIGFKVVGYSSQLFFPVAKRVLFNLATKYTIQNGSRDFFPVLKNSIIFMTSCLVPYFSEIKFAFSYLSGFFTKKNEIIVRTLLSPPQEADALCRKFIAQWGGATVCRDNGYLSWRLFSNPYIRPVFRAVYRKNILSGWLAYSLDENSIGYIVDIFVADANAPEVIRILLQDAVLRLKNAGAKGIRLWHINNHPFDLLVKKIGKKSGFLFFKKGNPVVAWFSASTEQRESIQNFNDWYISRINTEGILG